VREKAATGFRSLQRSQVRDASSEPTLRRREDYDFTKHHIIRGHVAVRSGDVLLKIEQLEKVTVDFLIQPSLPDNKGGKLRDIEPDFAGVIAPGLHLARPFATACHILGMHPAHSSCQKISFATPREDSFFIFRNRLLFDLQAAPLQRDGACLGRGHLGFRIRRREIREI